MTRIVYRPKAEVDVEAVFDWYESREAGLGRVFREELEAAEIRIARSPDACKAILGKARRCFLRRFPYLLLFVIDDEDIVVVGCFHARTSTATKRR